MSREIVRNSKEMKEILLKTFEYNYKTGIVTRILKNGRPCSDTKYYINHYGYFVTRVYGTAMLIHRVAWLLHYGEFPKNQLDHINGNRLDNRICNLRDATSRENLQNMKVHRDGKKLVGTVFHKKTKRWFAVIWLDGKSHALGGHNTEQEAHEAYKKALKDYIENGKVKYTQVFTANLPEQCIKNN
jgi:hypothetical protein